jgi:hypothetical protein
LSRRTGRPILAEFLCRRKRNGGNNAERSFFKAVTLDRLAPDESAKAAIFLASDYTSYIKGTELLVKASMLYRTWEQPLALCATVNFYAFAAGTKN